MWHCQLGHMGRCWDVPHASCLQCMPSGAASASRSATASPEGAMPSHHTTHEPLPIPPPMITQQALCCCQLCGSERDCSGRDKFTSSTLSWGFFFTAMGMGHVPELCIAIKESNCGGAMVVTIMLVSASPQSYLVCKAKDIEGCCPQAVQGLPLRS